ncbi:MAG: hypothetical protein P8I91_04770 [Phycisphaerales bacterium]|nr:hypothetical protein [Phycisphaerales bacterium]
MGTWHQKFLLVGFLLLSAGCMQQVGTPAPGSVVELDASEAASVYASFSLVGQTSSDPPLQLLPKSGVRWTDVLKAVQTLEVPRAPNSEELLFSIISSDIGPEKASFRMETAQHWPVLLTATLDGEQIQFVAIVGPYPQDATAKKQSRALEKAAYASLIQWGRRPQLPVIRR